MHDRCTATQWILRAAVIIGVLLFIAGGFV